MCRRRRPPVRGGRIIRPPPPLPGLAVPTGQESNPVHVPAQPIKRRTQHRRSPSLAFVEPNEWPSSAYTFAVTAEVTLLFKVISARPPPPKEGPPASVTGL